MDAEAPRVVIPVSCAPKKAPCPHCGRLGRRKRILTREVRTLAYKTITILNVTYGEYAARCDCCSSFRTNPDGVLPKAKYDNKVRQAVLDRIIDDGLNVEATRHSLKRDFWLDLSTGFVYDCLRDAAAELDLAPHRQAVLQRFSGVLCVDEIHLGAFTLLLATDPVGDFPVAFALVSANDQEHMERFLRNLQRHGLMPKVVVTDRSSLYPTLLATLWPDAEHQLCVFHVMQDINELVLDAVRRLRRKLARRGERGRQQVRTNNHVERCNRQLRFWEKVRYKWRRRRTLVRFVVLALDHWWTRTFSQESATPQRRARSSKSLAKAA